MCGIVGYFQFQGTANFDLPHFIKLGRDQLAHRGPDDAGLYVSPDKSCVLGSRRLSIIDLSPRANQPLTNEDESVWLVFNGEIYNHLQLRRHLIELGHRFRSACDAEVMLHLYEEHGASLVNYVDGIFSFVLYDAERRSLFGARDRFGVKPFYYSLSASRFAFASEPKALLAFPDIGREPNVDEVPSFLTFSCVPGPATLFKDIQKLEPGTQFEVSGNGFRKQRYWMPTDEPAGRHRENPVALLDLALRNAVTKRLHSDVAIGTTLSGGIDSSLIAFLMTETLGAPVKTFTVGYPGDESDQGSDLHYARKVSGMLRSDHHEIIITRRQFLRVFEEDLPAITDDPIGSPSEIAILHLAKFVKRVGVTVLQVGEGSDELFCGYNMAHQVWKFHQRFSVFRHVFPRRFAEFLGSALYGSTKGNLMRQLVHRYSRKQQLYWGYGLVFGNQDLEMIHRQCLPARTDPYERLRSRIETATGFKERPYLDQLAITDLLLQLPERLLMRLDKATMRYGVEGREPFLDRDVLKVASCVPARLRRGKEILKMYGLHKLPDEILSRPKSGFPTARSIFLGPAVFKWIRHTVFAKRFIEFAGFKMSALEHLVTQCETNGSRFAHVWSVFMLSLWFHHWVENSSGPR